MHKTLSPVIILFLLTCLLSLGLFQGALVNGHDALSGLIRALCLDKYLMIGQVLPRWSPDLNFGYGSPMFNFYPPFFYMFTVMLSKFTSNMLLALNLTSFIFWLVSGVGMYLFARELWGKRGGLLSAVTYLYAPYHIQDLYVRGAFAEFTAFAFFPLILLSIYKVSQNQKRRYILLGVISTFLLSLTHNIMSMLFLPIVIIYIVFLFVMTKNYCIFKCGAIILVLGLMMSSFFWLPALFEKKMLNLSYLISMRYDFHKNFVTFAQLFSPPWVRLSDMQGISFQIGLSACLLSLVPIECMFRNLKSNRNVSSHYFFFLSLGIFSIFFTLASSVVFWDHISILKFIQFPWRILAIIVFAVSVLSGSFMVLFKKNVISNFLLVTAVIFIIFSSFKFLWPINTVEVDESVLKRNIVNTVYLGEGEYTPMWIKTPVLAVPPEKFQIIQGVAQLSKYRSFSSVGFEVSINTMTTSLICFHSYYFPGWRAFIDDNEVSIDPNNTFGLILFQVTPGDHILKVVFGSTPVRTIATGISCFGFGFLLVLFIFYSKWERFIKV